jgi:hypothetical protein
VAFFLLILLDGWVTHERLKSPLAPFFVGGGGFRKFSQAKNTKKGGDTKALNEGSKKGIAYFLFTQHSSGGEK